MGYSVDKSRRASSTDSRHQLSRWNRPEVYSLTLLRLLPTAAQRLEDGNQQRRRPCLALRELVLGQKRVPLRIQDGQEVSDPALFKATAGQLGGLAAGFL